jgi:hypothetical protein
MGYIKPDPFQRQKIHKLIKQAPLMCCCCGSQPVPPDNHILCDFCKYAGEENKKTPPRRLKK